MKNWKSRLKADTTDWLLEEDNPSVRYLTLIDILDRPLNENTVKNARRQIMEFGSVPKILSKQKEGGYWETPENFYIKAKYKGTVWSFILLATLGADGRDTRIKKACEFILKNSQDPDSGGFAYQSDKKGGGDRTKLLPCLTGNMVWCLIRFGYLNDPRVRKGIDWIVKYQRFDDAIEKAPECWPYDRFENCWGKHTCHMGVVKALKALAEIPPDKRSSGVKETIDKAAKYLLKHRIYKRSHDLKGIARPDWLKFGFPLMWNTDLLEIAGILVKLGYRDAPVKEALDIIISKQDENGRWLLEGNKFKNRMQVNIEPLNKPSKWVTLNAVKTIKAFFK